ncbi:uncharacterized protein AB675_4356 [Cyphellophora attinorum]|uniref:MYND-type domain-containing protein n=1 Tax=Cyphellophora attinorum TaxID=1664694 RepID=A0A0N0NJ54_9EURO|nr:uncharacterized protein AB675_4356 [Phialophora attinorum]KPI36591.1 hypothetical protein AB675_4356 [Phialophora attinorum]
MSAEDSQARKCQVCAKSEAALDGSSLLQCGRCKNTKYCSKACQSTDWPTHKTNCTAAASSIHNFTQGPPDRSPKKVLLLELEDYSWLGDMYTAFHTSMHQASDYQRIPSESSPAAVVDAITTAPNAIILFEPSIMSAKKRFRADRINRTLVAYVKAGGTLIFGCQTSNHVSPPDLDRYLKDIWDLPWTMGNYQRIPFERKLDSINGKELPRVCNAKAVQLNGVAPGDVVYCQPEEYGPGGAPVVWHEYGSGRIGWVGDVNNEEESGIITRAMCGI